MVYITSAKYQTSFERSYNDVKVFISYLKKVSRLKKWSNFWIYIICLAKLPRGQFQIPVFNMEIFIITILWSIFLIIQ
jgi:hypothetical protein